MCGRYLSPDEAALERAFELSAPADYRQSYNLAPSQLAPVLLPDDAGGIRLQMLVWGFQPHWAKRAWINARSETVFESRAFAPSAKRHRCLVPAIGWYEWQGAKAPKQPWVFHQDGFTPFTFAGIWTSSSLEEVANFAILTTSAPPDLAPIHGRMPVVLADEHRSRWLDPGLSVPEAGEVLGNNRQVFSVYKVSSYVNKPANNDPRCIQQQQ